MRLFFFHAYAFYPLRAKQDAPLRELWMPDAPIYKNYKNNVLRRLKQSAFKIFDWVDLTSRIWFAL